MPCTASSASAGSASARWCTPGRSPASPRRAGEGRPTMTMTDPISDMLTRIRNANIAMHDDVRMPSSKVKEALAEILHKEGYIEGYQVADNTQRPGRVLHTKLRYPDRTNLGVGK